MKLKFINLLLASVLFVGSAQVFTSCKDNEADSLAQLTETTITLNQKLEDDARRLTALEAALKQEIADREAAIKDLAAEIEKVKNQIPTDYVTQKQLADAIADLSKKIKDNADAITILQGDVNRIDAALTIINSRLDGIDVDLTQIKADILKNATDIVTINTAIGDIRVDITTINGQIAQIVDGLIQIGTKIVDLETRVTILETTLQQVQSDLSALENRVGLLEGRLDAAEDRLDAVEGDVNTLKPQVATLNEFMNEWKPLLPTIQQNAADALAQANINAADIANLKVMMETLKGLIELGNSQAEAAVADLQSQINSLVAQVEKCATLEDLEAAVKQLQAEAETYYQASIGFTVYMCAGIRQYIEDNLAAINANITDINNNLAALDGKIDLSVATLNGEIARLERLIIAGDQNVLNELNTKLAALDEKYYGYYVTLLTSINQLFEITGDLNTKYSELASQIEGLEGDLSALDTLVGQLSTALSEGLNAVNTRVSNLETRVQNLENALAPLSSRIEEVAGRINSIIIQQTDNAVFGTLNLPVGINSNMIIAFANDDAIESEFPTTRGRFSYNGEKSGLGVEDGEVLPFTGDNTVNCEGAIMERDADNPDMGVLGTVYLTVNPANVDLKGKTFNIVKSNGQVLPIQIQPVESDKELNFGYTRSSNGFYEAKALINVNDLAAVRFVLDQNFKSTVGGILKDAKSLKEPSTIANLGAALYSQVNGFLPALGVQASWTESNGENMVVTSQYGLAAATISPLSLTTFLPLNLPHLPNIPDFGDLSDRFDVIYDQLVGQLNIKLNAEPFTIDLGNVNISITTPQISFADFDKTINGTVHVNTTVEVPFDVTVTVKDDDGNTFTGTASGKSEGVIDKDFTADVDVEQMLLDMQNAVNKALVDAMGTDVGASISAQINTELSKIATALEGKVNDLLDNMQDQVDTAFATLKNFIDGKLNSVENRLSSLVGPVQSLINRINNVLDDPTHYVQPNLFYKNNGKLHRMSSVAGLPTVLNASVDAPGITLIPTTYTLETVVPLYQKYVAVTKVYANDDASKTNVASVQNTANEGQYMNTVLNAQRHLVPIELKKGYTYEILYQGIDYAGNVSGKKYYVTVK